MIPVKVCGITRLEDGLLAASAGAAAVGFIFWPHSPRYIEPPRAQAITAQLPPLVTSVGVFVDTPPAEVERIAREVGLGAIQLHGRESCADYAPVGLRLIKAVAVGERFSMEGLDDVPGDVTVLLDAQDPVRLGGTGRSIDWAVGARVARARRVVLSGGLRPDNVRAAVEAVRPYAVDVSSGVEERPGIKAPDLVRAFLAAVRQVG